MYAFFRAATGLPAGRLVDPRPLLMAAGLTPVRREERLGGFLVSELWASPISPAAEVSRTTAVSPQPESGRTLVR